MNRRRKQAGYTTAAGSRIEIRAATPLDLAGLLAEAREFVRVLERRWLAETSPPPRGRPIAVAAFVDYYVRCNECRWIKLKSNPGGCPRHHRSGFCYLGPTCPRALAMAAGKRLGRRLRREGLA
jgi:hypothetical protein